MSVALTACVGSKTQATDRHPAGAASRADVRPGVDAARGGDSPGAGGTRLAGCDLPHDLASGPGTSSRQESLIPLCEPGKTPALVSAAAAWLRAAPNDPAAATWLSQALYVRALEADGLRSPCAPEPLFVDRGPPPDLAEAILYEADKNAQIGWGRILRSAPSRRDAEISLCLAQFVLAAGFDPIVFRRRVHILMDLGRDPELRDSIRDAASAPEKIPGGPATWFSAYITDYLGVGREIEAGELTLVLRELDPAAAPSLDPFRRAIVTRIRRRYAMGTEERRQREDWIAKHAFDADWVSASSRSPAAAFGHSPAE